MRPAGAHSSLLAGPRWARHLRPLANSVPPAHPPTLSQTPQAVKDKGAVFFCQIWHCGRASHPHFQPDEALPPAPSAIAISDGSKLFSMKTFQMEEYPVPRALETAEIAGLVEDYAQVGGRPCG